MHRRASFAAASLALLVTACTGQGATKGASPAASTSDQPGATAAASTTTIGKAALTFNPGTGTKDVALTTPISVSITGAKLVDVKVGGAPAGHELLGSIDAEGSWSTTSALVPGMTYTLTASYKGGDGMVATKASTFTTVQPAKKVKVNVAPLDGSTVGVGQPIAVYFSTAPTDRAAATAALGVVTDPPVEGAWHWMSATQADYRPAAYWAPGTKVTLNANIGGADLGGGAWGVESRKIAFTIGESHYSLVDAKTHLMTVFTNGQLVRTMKVSTGRDSLPTKSGVHVVNDKAETTVMDSSTYGVPADSPGGYKETVHWNVRISNSGEFVHAAPWSTGSQGRANVSHGCVNASVEDAKWFYGYSHLGDVVEVKGTSETMTPINGFGDWNVPWDAWTKA